LEREKAGNRTERREVGRRIDPHSTLSLETFREKMQMSGLLVRKQWDEDEEEEETRYD